VIKATIKFAGKLALSLAIACAFGYGIYGFVTYSCRCRKRLQASDDEPGC